MRGKAFVNDVFKVHGFAGQACAFFDRAVQRVFGHGDFARLFNDQAQPRVGGGVGTVACRNHDVFRQFAEDTAFGVSRQIFVFGFPLSAHGCIPLSRVFSSRAVECRLRERL